MRIIILAAFCTLATLPAQAQQVQRIKATGANAAGICAGSLDMVGQYLSRAQNPNPQRISNVTVARDFFADLPRYPSADIAAAANAFIKLMSDRIAKAGTLEGRQAVQRELVEVSSGCMRSASAEIQAYRSAQAQGRAVVPGAALPPAATTVQPYVAPPPATTQPYTIAPAPSTVQPYVSEPSVILPYSTEPLVLDPIAPAQ